ncbi:MAG: hypothetical protein ACRD0Z_04645, partial [Acidimicrobiales bacterium]
VTLTASGAVPDSSTQGPLGKGSYSYEAAYSGDANYGASVASCESFSVGLTPSSIATVVDDAATGEAWSGTEATGASAYDTSVVSGEQGGIVPSGTVTYSYFGNGTCAGTAASSSTVTLTASGAVPDSSTQGPLGKGSYSYEAAYSGDANYGASVASCESFSVKAGLSTPVPPVATGEPWASVGYWVVAAGMGLLGCCLLGETRRRRRRMV